MSPAVAALWFLAESGAVLQQDAAIHHDENSSGAGFLGGFLVNDFFLHPHGRDLQLNRLVDHFLDEFRAAENVNDVDLLGHVE